MNRSRLPLFAFILILSGCQAVDNRGTIAQLRNVSIDIEEQQLEGGLEKAIAGYEHFLRETPDSALTPEAIRRLADLKVEKEYGLLREGAQPVEGSAAAGLVAPPPATPLRTSPVTAAEEQAGPQPKETEVEFEERSTGDLHSSGTGEGIASSSEETDDLERAGALEAIELYRKLLDDYPLYERNDQVLYQMSRAYEELGRIDEAMDVMALLVRDFPRSRYIDEVQFRRAEYFFTRKRYLDAEDAYTTIVNIGPGSTFYQFALYKLGWTFYKQELHEEALQRFIALLDYKVSVGYDFAQTEDEQERKRMDDTFRVISLSFSSLGGADSVMDYFARHGKRSYEDSVYGNLGEFYFDKRRYNDAAATYNAFVSRNPFHRVSPRFHMRVIEIHAAGGFPTLVLDSKKEFARNYGLQSEYWQHFEPADRPEVLGYLKTNLIDLANHYHALYRDPVRKEEKPVNFEEAMRWYRQFLASFPRDEDTPPINYQLADLLLENRLFDQAAVEYEKTAYDYPRHEKSSTAGYAAVYAYRQHLDSVPAAKKEPARREAVRSSLKFAETYPEHEKAAVVLGAAADDLYDMKEYEEALAAGQMLIEVFPETDTDILRGAWLVVAHSSYELKKYSEAESAYLMVLALLPDGDKARDVLIDNLAATIYKQGEVANGQEDYRAAADHFLRVGQLAPTSKIRASAEYDAAAALVKLKEWEAAAIVLTGFRNLFPGHQLQPEVTKKIAFVYRESGKLSLAADEYERIERESKDDEVRREALLAAAELHEEVGSKDRALAVYRRYVEFFPRPVDFNLETRNKIADMLKAANDRKGYLDELGKIVAIDASAGSERTDRTRFLAAKAGLVLAEPGYERFMEVRLEQPFETNLRRKRDLMKASMQEYNRLLDYEVGEVTAAAMFHLAEINAHFSKALMESERPAGLSPLESEQYELAIEEQSYPFEEQAIAIHENNLKLVAAGIYNSWTEKSLQKLAEFVPARYAKPEEPSAVVGSLDSFVFELERPAPPPPIAEVEAPAAAGVAGESESKEGAPDAGAEGQKEEPVQKVPPAAEAEPMQVSEAPAPVQPVQAAAAAVQ